MFQVRREGALVGKFWPKLIGLAGSGWPLLVAMALIVLAIHASLSPPVQAEAPPVAEIFDARLTGNEERTRFVADLDTAVSYSVYVVADPYRVVVDMPGVRFSMLPDTGDQEKGLIKSFRFGQIEPGKSRIVIDTNGPVLIEKSFVLNPQDGQPARMVIDLVQTDLRTFSRIKSNEAQPEQELAQTGPPATAQDAPLPDTLAALLAREGVAPIEQETASIDLQGQGYVPKPRPKPLRGGAGGLAASAPDQPSAPPAKPVIVLDPGHGGMDGGTVSRSGVAEKEVVLSFARELRRRLNASGRFEVHMTRNDDTFVPLGRRVRIARQKEADLFIAIHADSLRQQGVRGATVYTLSDKASDAEAAALAEKENAADFINGIDLGENIDHEVGGILLDLALRETKNHSIYFARRVVKSLGPVTPLNRRPMRSAGFKVLKAPDVPSVLLELGYLSNRRDEKNLVSDKWRENASSAVAQAIDAFFSPEVAARQQQAQ